MASIDRVIVELNTQENSLRHQYKFHSKIKSKLRDFQSRSIQVNKASSQKIVKSKKMFLLDAIPSTNVLYRKVNYSPKIFSSFFINKLDKKTDISHYQSKSKQKSAKSIRQSLEQKIIENVRQNLNKKIPRVKLVPIKRQKSKTEQREQDFVIWSKRQQQEEMCSAINLLTKDNFHKRKIETARKPFQMKPIKYQIQPRHN